MSDGARSPIDRQSNHLQVSTARQQVSPHTHPHGETLVARGAHVFSHTASVRGPPSLDQPGELLTLTTMPDKIISCFMIPLL